MEFRVLRERRALYIDLMETLSVGARVADEQRIIDLQCKIDELDLLIPSKERPPNA